MTPTRQARVKRIICPVHSLKMQVIIRWVNRSQPRLNTLNNSLGEAQQGQHPQMVETKQPLQGRMAWAGRPVGLVIHAVAVSCPGSTESLKDEKAQTSKQTKKKYNKTKKIGGLDQKKVVVVTEVLKGEIRIRNWAKNEFYQFKSARTPARRKAILFNHFSMSSAHSTKSKGRYN